MKFSQLQKARNLLIYGYGKEGKAAYAFISKRFPHLPLKIYDDEKREFSKKLNFTLFDVIVLSPSVSIKKLNGVRREKITSVTDLFFDNISDDLRCKVIGVTGTKGKSTTVKFISEMLRRAGFKTGIGGNYGIPLLKLFERFVKGKYDFIVVELSSYQLENLRTSPGIAILLNLYSDHLDHHGTFSKYKEAKQNIYKYQKPNDLLIVPRKWKKLIGGHKALLSPPAPKTLFPSKVKVGRSYYEPNIFSSAHFLSNFGTSMALASHLDIPKRVFHKTAKSFKGLPHRLEFITRKNNVRFYDDSISTNPDSTLEGVKFLSKELGSIILGGQDRKQDFTDLIKKLKKINVLIIVLRSETAGRILKTTTNLGYKRIVSVDDMKEAVKFASRETPRGKICLLSTAAPSYDNYKNYLEKGKIFKESIRSLPKL